MSFKLPTLALVALAATAFALPGHAAECSLTVEANDAMQYNTKSIDVPVSCKNFEITLKHTGKLDAKVMGHNMVITTKADYQAVATAGMGAGADNDYVPVGDARVIAHSEVIGGGESTSFTIPVGKLSADEDYEFFCSFPGHYALMRGSLNLVQ